jgi:hypothetical protein
MPREWDLIFLMPRPAAINVEIGAVNNVLTSVAEPHHFYAAPAPAPGKNFDAAPAAPATAPTLLYSKTKFLKRTKV